MRRAHFMRPAAAATSAAGYFPGAPAAIVRQGGFRLRVLILPLLLLLWEGFPLSLMGSEVTTTRYLVAAILLVALAWGLLQASFGRQKLDTWTILPLVLISWNVFVSLISNTLIFPQPLSGWIFALYEITPILMIFLCRALGLRSDEVIDAIVWTAAFIVVITIFDHFSPVQALTRYTRIAYADTGLRRLVIMKTEVSLALAIAVARFSLSETVKQRIFWAGFAAIMSYSLFMITESRLSIAAVMIAVSAFVLFMLRGHARVLMLGLGVVLSVTVLPILLSKYIDYFYSKADYVSQDLSIAWRVKTLDFYYNYFEETYGLGFGVMSTGPDKDNILSFGTTQAGRLVGSTGYNFYIFDLGMMGALVQFGWIGLAIVIVLSFKAVLQMVSAGRVGATVNHLEVGMVGLVMFAYLLSPWPTNFFTLQWSALSGGFMWAIAGQSAREYVTGKGKRPRGSVLARQTRPHQA